MFGGKKDNEFFSSLQITILVRKVYEAQKLENCFLEENIKEKMQN